MSLQILLFERETTEGERLSSSLQEGGYVVQRVDNLQSAEIHMQARMPDLLLMDWACPDIASIDRLQTLCTSTRAHGLSLIVLSCCGEASSKIAVLDAGADDYMVKPCDTGELHARIRAVLRRRPVQSSEAIPQVRGLQLDPLTLGVTVQADGGRRPIALSPLEFRLLHFFVTHPKRVHSRHQLLDRVWGNHVFVGERTVDVHVRKLRMALAETPCAGLIQTVRGGGYCLAVDVDVEPETPSMRATGLPLATTTGEREVRGVVGRSSHEMNAALPHIAAARRSTPDRMAATKPRPRPE